MTNEELQQWECWVYQKTEWKGRDGWDLWTVGYFDGEGEWHPESDHSSLEEAKLAWAEIISRL